MQAIPHLFHRSSYALIDHSISLRLQFLDRLIGSLDAKIVGGWYRHEHVADVKLAFDVLDLWVIGAIEQRAKLEGGRRNQFRIVIQKVLHRCVELALTL